MRRSIRWRLQAWYALVLVSAIAGFAGILYYRAQAARFRAVDAALEGGAAYLDAHLRRFPPHELDLMLPRRPPPAPFRKGGPFGDPPFPPPPPLQPRLERLLEELILPPHTGPEPVNDGNPGPYFAVWRADGSLLKASGLPRGIAFADVANMPPSPEPRLRHRGEYREATMIGPLGTQILVGRSVRGEHAALGAFAWQLTGAGALVLVIGMVGGWLVSARILRPVAAISATASAISATNLDQRIDPQTVDRELEELATVLNAMFDRLEGAFERQARFTADASHELRTPLAVIRSHAELALARPRTAEEYREAIQTCLRASTRMTALVEGLLMLARADAGKLDLVRQSVDLRHVVEESVALLRPLAEGKRVSLHTRLDQARVTGDPVRLAQVVTNLVSNGVQYNRVGGEVRVQLEVTAGEAVLTVADTGCGIPVEDRPHIFERFYRVDRARSRASGGTGLGLAICKSVVEAHGGTIGFTTEPGRGSTFWVRLPCAPPQETAIMKSLL